MNVTTEQIMKLDSAMLEKLWQELEKIDGHNGDVWIFLTESKVCQDSNGEVYLDLEGVDFSISVAREVDTYFRLHTPNDMQLKLKDAVSIYAFIRMWYSVSCIAKPVSIAEIKK